MEGITEIREEFLKKFIGRVARSVIESGMFKTNVKYYDIEKIKQNIKIYERPESTLVNAIIMNQNPEIQKLMQPSEIIGDIYTDKANIRSIMENGREDVLPLNIPPAKKRVSNFNQQLSQAPASRIRHPLRMPFSQPMPFMHQKKSMRILHPSNNLRSTMVNPSNITPFSAGSENTTVLGIERLDRILADPGVQTIECPGPNKQMLVYKSGAVKTANLTLTADEITNIMKALSEKTRIPLVSGVFKAAHGNLVITAVMSEFVGTRFIIQKKPNLPSPQPSSLYQ